MTIDQKREALCIYDEHMTDDERREYAEFITQMNHLASSFQYLRDHLLRYAHQVELQADRRGSEPADTITDIEMDYWLIMEREGSA